MTCEIEADSLNEHPGGWHAITECYMTQPFCGECTANSMLTLLDLLFGTDGVTDGD